MKSIQRLSVLVALILCVTVGGVYAAWTYAASAGVAEEVNKGVSIAPVTMEGSIGSYEVAFAEFSIVIDQTAPGDYTPRLAFHRQSDDGSLDFKFTPTAVASDEVKANGIESTISFSSVLQHEGTAIFNFPLTITVLPVNGTGAHKWTAVDSNSDNIPEYFTFSISNAELANYIKLNYTTKLDTYAKYQAFEQSLQGGTLTIAIANKHYAPST